MHRADAGTPTQSCLCFDLFFTLESVLKYLLLLDCLFLVWRGSLKLTGSSAWVQHEVQMSVFSDLFLWGRSAAPEESPLFACLGAGYL